MKMFAVVFAIILFSGCGKHRSEMIQHSYLKNYSLGEIKTAYIGQSVVKVRDLYANYDEFQRKFAVKYYLKASNDFELNGKYIKKKFFEFPVKVVGKKDGLYPAAGYTSVDGLPYTVVNMVNEAHEKKEEVGILVDEKGRIFKENILDDDHDRIMKSESSSITPDVLTLLKTDKIVDKKHNEINIDLLACYTNFELIYGGINNVTLSIAYREFTIDDLARPSFSQNLVYETTAKQIRFKNILIDVFEATNEKIVYKVVSDGLKESIFPKDKTPIDYKECKYMYEIKRKSLKR